MSIRPLGKFIALSILSGASVIAQDEQAPAPKHTNAYTSQFGKADRRPGRWYCPNRLANPVLAAVHLVSAAWL